MSLSNDKVPWEKFHQLHVVKRLRQLVGDLWKIQINFTDAHGYLRGVEPGAFFKPLHQVCKKIVSDKKGFESCMLAVRKTADLKKNSSPVFDKCNAGFSTLSIPIHFNNQYLGSIFCDGFLMEESKDEQKTEILKRFKTLFPDDEKIHSYIDELPVLTSNELSFLKELMGVVVQEILQVHSNLSTSKNEIEELKSQLLVRYDFGNMIGKSHSMQHVYSLIEKIKDSNANILIQGENGTGKELVARAIHYNSKRNKGPFVAINCGAFNENLLESELFGHVKGSFTGAIKDKMGLFESANEGTLFLDEVGEMPLAMQVKMLRVLQENMFRPVGSTETRQTTARVICATNSDLEKMIEEGLFRKDLFYRINVINMYLPPLRERMEDIPILIEHFSKHFSKIMNTSEKLPSKECMKYLLSYSWPGNVRELENEIERLYVLSGEDSLLKESDLSLRLLRSEHSENSEIQGGTLKEALEHVEYEMIKQGLERTRWNKTQLAKELGISRAGLLLKVEKYGLDRKAS